MEKDFDKLISDYMDGNVAAMVLKQHLIPVEGKGSPFFPPTFAPEDKTEKSDYCIDGMKDGTKICLIDTVGSQANRMEPIFMNEPYNKLIPQITIHTKIKDINLCEVGHRLADALLRGTSEFSSDIEPALKDLASGDAVTIAKIAPTSLVFGLWDSRGTEVKIPRIVSSVIRAYDIDKLTRSAQYFIPVNYKHEDLLGEPKNKQEGEMRSKIGLRDNPATNTPGGIIAHGDIRRDTVVNFAALQKITAKDKNNMAVLQKYILGLALVSAISTRNWYLREGCNLILDPEMDAPKWKIVYTDGRSEEIIFEHDDILNYAKSQAKLFGVGEDKEITVHADKIKKNLADGNKRKTNDG